VPQTAIQRDEKNHVVFKILGPGHYRMLPVTVIVFVPHTTAGITIQAAITISRLPSPTGYRTRSNAA